MTLPNFLTISTTNELLRVPLEHILYAQSDGNYCTLFLSNGKEVLLTMQLGQLYQQLLEIGKEQVKHHHPSPISFARVGRSLIVNVKFTFLINPSKSQVQLLDSNLTLHDLKASREALLDFKNQLERTLKP